jgi:hypothetical protein
MWVLGRPCLAIYLCLLIGFSILCDHVWPIVQDNSVSLFSSYQASSIGPGISALLTASYLSSYIPLAHVVAPRPEPPQEGSHPIYYWVVDL